MKISKTFKFDMAHMLEEHDGKCRNLHGHSYELTIFLEGDLVETGPKSGMVMDYGDVKDIVYNTVLKNLDHSFIYNRNNVLESKIAVLLMDSERKVYPILGSTTAENITKEIFKLLNVKLKKLSCVVLKETDSSSVEYYGE
ncbi:6-carboxytetrahydropterin synthase QueD [Streptococcus uberis]|uniref:6-carboxytetrahydropterin synthase QueD n=1 Tax=Streptococcus uberis TaxID=1349 RepID=UPI003D3658AA